MKTLLQLIVSSLLIAGCSNVSEKYISYDQLDSLKLNYNQKAFVLTGDTAIALIRWWNKGDTLVVYKDSVFVSDSAITHWDDGKIIESDTLTKYTWMDLQHRKDMIRYTVQKLKKIPAELIDSVRIQTKQDDYRGVVRISIHKNEITPSVILEKLMGPIRMSLPFSTTIIRNAENGDVYGSYTAVGVMIYVYGYGMMFNEIKSSSFVQSLFAIPLFITSSEFHYTLNQPGPDCTFPLSGSVFVKTSTDIFDSWGRYIPGAGIELDYNFLSGRSKYNSSIELQFGVEKLFYMQKSINPENIRLFTTLSYAF